MRIRILDFVGNLLGIEFSINGVPYGASHFRSQRVLAKHYPKLARERA